ncbi:endonuclease/exonuclease/phosphatase family protein [Pseudonocardia sp. DSM 110487]|uniref:endonuclease/exonuclease/phosphatase family protein n=1 Tax=Pseudonocardia sp. DSM 110487 TaxID=2865833 RepID=UPI001C695266|nr:endonuclease/exonuclease/phosphatase family protein [Pseudonocardia sp. DSM 110487]QYN39424.1 endonuclease/exonuclease/phosphatase family protein [Pseudonocardia sp. DSM 110487]
MAIACCLLVGLAACTGVTTGLSAAGGTPAAQLTTSQVRVLQLNLCNSGIAACYSAGRSIEEAAAVIRAESPDLVTLNEICEDDLRPLERALARAVPGGKAVSAFQAARDRNTGEGYRCANGEQYGIGIVSRWRAVSGTAPAGGIYPVQDEDDPEERAWLCLDVAATPALGVCTTHLAYTKREVASGQCRYLFDTVIGGMRARNGAASVVVGADLNLDGDNPDLRSCIPPDSALTDDGAVQHVVATPDFVLDTSRTIELRIDTEHPGLLVTLARRAS